MFEDNDESLPAKQYRRFLLKADLYKFADEILELFEGIDIAEIGWDHQQLHIVVIAYLNRISKSIDKVQEFDIKNNADKIIKLLWGLQDNEDDTTKVYKKLGKLIPYLWV